MNSNFNKSMLWVVMLSAISQAYPMGIASKAAQSFMPYVQRITPGLVNKAGVVGAGVASAAATGYGLNKLSAPEVIAEAALEVEAGNVVTPEELGTTIDKISKMASFKQFAKDSGSFLLDHKSDIFCGMVTLSSVSYLVTKSGVLVPVKNHWKKSLGAVTLVAATLAGAAYMYPDVALDVAKSALNVTTNPYTALAAGAAVAAYGVGSKLTNKYAQAGSGAAVVSAAAGIAVANRFGYADWAKNGVSFAANKVKEGAMWTAKNGYNYVAKPAYDYTVAPVVSQAVKHPYIAGVAATGVVAGTAAALYYKPWKKPAKNQRKVVAPAPTPATRTAPTNTAPAGKTNVVGHSVAVNLGVLGDNQPIVAMKHDYKKDIPTELIKAIKGDKTALETAKKYAGNNKELMNAIDGFMVCPVVDYLKKHYANPKIKIFGWQFEGRKKSSQLVLDKLAALCGVTSIELNVV